MFRVFRGFNPSLPLAFPLGRDDRGETAAHDVRRDGAGLQPEAAHSVHFQFQRLVVRRAQEIRARGRAGAETDDEGAFRLGVQQQNTRYDYAPDQNVDEITYNIRVWARFRSGLDLSIDATRTRDTGSPQVAREYTNTMANDHKLLVYL